MGELGKFADNAKSSNKALQYLLLVLQVVVICVLSRDGTEKEIEILRTNENEIFLKIQNENDLTK